MTQAPAAQPDPRTQYQAAQAHLTRLDRQLAVLGERERQTAAALTRYTQQARQVLGDRAQGVPDDQLGALLDTVAQELGVEYATAATEAQVLGDHLARAMDRLDAQAQVPAGGAA